MLGNFWDGLAEKLAERWSTQELSIPLLFWLGGIVCWVQWLGDWNTLTAWLNQINNPVVYAILLVSGLFILIASTTIARWLQSPVLHLVEGYWPWPFRWLRFEIARWHDKRLSRKAAKWDELDSIPPEKRTAKQLSDHARLDTELAYNPLDERLLLPTRLGNLIRSAELYPRVRYGLAIDKIWPRLWLVAPDSVRTALIDARRSLDAATRLFFWGVLFVFWSIWTWWASLIAVITVCVAYWAMCQAAGAYGDLIRAVFDVHRFELYEGLHLSPPISLDSEVRYGEHVNEYLFRGFIAPDIQLNSVEKE